MTGLRVIAGKARGRKLHSVPGSSTRPITDRVKESLFNIIGADIQAATVLDLFAGTGSVGIEAISRGADYTLFIDIDQQAVATVRTNLVSTDLISQGGTANRCIYFLHMADRTFDYVYIAPPQYKGLWKRTLSTLDAHPVWLSSDAWVIVQIHPREIEPIELQNLVEFDRRQYGSTILIFYQVSPDGS
jgi:16S rRNA (guanine(966)-N(2))-methyltransferase RsmD